MENETRKAVKKAMIKIDEIIDLLEKVKGDNEEIDAVCDNLVYCYADLEYELNS